jgi:hypothetical protein
LNNHKYWYHIYYIITDYFWQLINHIGNRNTLRDYLPCPHSSYLQQMNSPFSDFFSLHPNKYKAHSLILWGQEIYMIKEFQLVTKSASRNTLHKTNKKSTSELIFWVVMAKNPLCLYNRKYLIHINISFQKWRVLSTFMVVFIISQTKVYGSLTFHVFIEKLQSNELTWWLFNK